MDGKKIKWKETLVFLMVSVRRTVMTLMAVLLLGTALASAHSPVDPEDGEGLATATHVDDPAKSWAIYGRLDEGGDTWYFELELDGGDRLYLSLLATEGSFLPSIVVIGPGLEGTDPLPRGVEVPEGAGWVVVEGEEAEASFEPFTPGSYHAVARFDERVAQGGTYFVAVHSDSGGGPFSLAVGYVETFTASEWLSLPSSLMGIYRWEGQGWAVILGPAIAVIVGGLALLVWHQRRAERALTVFQWTSALSGLFIMAWAAMVITQMAMALSRSGWEPAAALTGVFAGASVVMGLYASSPSLWGPPVPDVGRRLGMVTVGVLTLLLYSGLYVGPALAFAAALLPDGMAGRTLATEAHFRQGPPLATGR